MNIPSRVNAEREAARVLEQFLVQLPRFEIEKIERDGTELIDKGIDARIIGRFSGKSLTLVVEVRNNGQPRIVRDAARSIHYYLQKTGEDAFPIVMAPYLSPQARQVCRDEGVGYLDFMGNALIERDTIYIRTEVPGQPEAERRALGSLFKPKSARILRMLFAQPGRSWRTADLAEAAQVSIGLVSRVGTALRERGWAQLTEQGLALTEPAELLDSWAENYLPPQGQEYRLYTALHGTTLDERLAALAQEEGRALLASFTAAQWMSPFARHPNQYFYADDAGLAALDRVLGLREAPMGANVVILVPDEDGVLDDAVELAGGRMATSPLQTYLDLMHGGERGEEAAAHLRTMLLDAWR